MATHVTGARGSCKREKTKGDVPLGSLVEIAVEQGMLEVEADSPSRTRSERCWIPKDHEEFYALVSSPLFKYVCTCIHESQHEQMVHHNDEHGGHIHPAASIALQIISIIFFILNLVLFLLFLSVSCLRYILYLRIFAAVLRHPHQSLFLATFPVGHATLINMTVLMCVPSWDHGTAVFAWTLWWIDSVLALTTCFHLTFVM